MVQMGMAEQAGHPVVFEVDQTPELILCRGEQFTNSWQPFCPSTDLSFFIEKASF